jgi:hypothetical protein
MVDGFLPRVPLSQESEQVMTPEEIREHVRRRPFQPFRVHLVDGTSYVVGRPELILVTRTVVVTGEGAGDDEVPRRIAYCDPDQITHLEPIPIRRDCMQHEIPTSSPLGGGRRPEPLLRLGTRPGELDLRFIGWRVQIELFLRLHSQLVIRLFTDDSSNLDRSSRAPREFYLYCYGASWIPALPDWRISRLSYSSSPDYHFITDRANKIVIRCSGFEFTPPFSIHEFLTVPGGPLPDLWYYRSHPDVCQRAGHPLPENLDGVFDT